MLLQAILDSKTNNIYEGIKKDLERWIDDSNLSEENKTAAKTIALTQNGEMRMKHDLYQLKEKSGLILPFVKIAEFNETPNIERFKYKENSFKEKMQDDYKEWKHETIYETSEANKNIEIHIGFYFRTFIF